MIILVGMLAGLFIFLFGPAEDGDETSAVTYYDDNGEAVVVNENISNTDSLAAAMLSFSPTVFFVVLLPPIIFNSGYHIQKDLFFRHLTPISLYAFGGTAICTGVVACILYSFQWLYGMECSFLELLTFGALISATDPVSTLAVFSSKKVDPQLFYLVFGESMLNDAVGLVLFDALAHLLENQMASQGAALAVGQEISQFLFDFVVAFLGSLVLGIAFALLMAYMMKLVDFRKTPILELCLATTFMYLPFVVAEILHLSGIVTVLFAGIACKRYAEPNFSDTTKVNADWVYRLTAHTTETFIFLELGLSVWSLLGSAFSLGFFLASLLACLVGRAINIYPITLMYNCFVGCAGKRKRTQETVEKMEANDEPSYVEATEENGDHRGSQRKLSIGNDDEDRFGDELIPSESSEDDSTIPWKTAHMMWFSGLRGAVSYGLVRTFPDTSDKATIVVTTMMLILLTTFLLGGTTEMVLNFLKIPTGIDENQYLASLQKRKLLPGFLLRFEGSKLYPFITRDACAWKDDKKNDADDSDDPELTPYEGMEVVEDHHTHRIMIVNTNRNGKIFDYGA
jgi:sodium/hydrogen exchanger 8